MLSLVHKFSNKISPASTKQLNALEHEMGSALPLGYREFMTTLGDGWYCDMIDVLTPDKVIANTKRRRQYLSDCFAELTPEHAATLSLDDASRGFVFGYMNPDGPYRSELWHVPGAAHPLYVLTPFHTDIYWVENGFLDPFELGRRQRTLPRSDNAVSVLRAKEPKNDASARSLFAPARRIRTPPHRATHPRLRHSVRTDRSERTSRNIYLGALRLVAASR